VGGRIDREPVGVDHLGRQLEDVPLPREFESGLITHEPLPEGRGVGVNDLQTAATAGLEVDEPVPLRRVEQQLPPSIDPRGDVDRGAERGRLVRTAPPPTRGPPGRNPPRRGPPPVRAMRASHSMAVSGTVRNTSPPNWTRTICPTRMAAAIMRKYGLPVSP